MSGPERPRRALVTGASRGIGQAIAHALSASGHAVAGAARTVADARTATDPRNGIVALPCDMADLAAVAALPGRAAEALGGPVDVLVHAAGIARAARVTDIALADWDEVFRVNVTSMLVLAQGCAPAMVARGWGRIVTVGSLYSRMGAPFSGSYTASKHALLGLTRVLAMELATKGVTANVVVPGWTDTEMVRAEARNVSRANGYGEDEAVRRFLRGQPIGRMVEPAEVAALVAFLCGDAAAAITGQALNIDGGSLQS
ncbi:SDR family NAD(P)-dependent oxidoreductase [Dactylosporangium sp. NPDC048998]|uniref:SDR family NAD(P)-dependent oxidoreductase n=1 Tax=Dactylosporangium sp. NPDC048998 TaxID=3363976 RepID=UPI003710BB23